MGGAIQRGIQCNVIRECCKVSLERNGSSFKTMRYILVIELENERRYACEVYHS